MIRESCEKTDRKEKMAEFNLLPVNRYTLGTGINGMVLEPHLQPKRKADAATNNKNLGAKQCMTMGQIM